MLNYAVPKYFFNNHQIKKKTKKRNRNRNIIIHKLTGKLSRHHIQLPQSNYQNYQYSNLQHYHINTAHLHCNYHICKNWWCCICNHPGVRWIGLMMPFDYYVWFTPSILTKLRIMNTTICCYLWRPWVCVCSSLSRDKLEHIHSDPYSIIQIGNSTISWHQIQIIDIISQRN